MPPMTTQPKNQTRLEAWITRVQLGVLRFSQFYVMDYETRLAQAQSIYAAGLKKVETTPEPEGQKFPNGSRVRVGQGECNATVRYTYAHAYGGGDVKSYCLDIDGYGEVSWYEEGRLSAISGENNEISDPI